MRLDSFFSFNYAITKPLSERWRYSTPILLAFAIISLALFTTVNVYLVGYDVVSVTTSNFNASHHLPWIYSLQTGDFSCQKHSFQLGDTFRTNVSAFSYSIFNFPSSEPDVNVQGSFSYANNTLESCDVTQFELVVSPGDRLIKTSAIVDCPPPLGFQASASWSYTNHPVSGIVPAGTFPNNSLARAILDAMSNFGGEAYLPIYDSQYNINSTDTAGTPPQRVYKLTVQGQPTCGSLSSDHCVQVRPNIGRTFYNAIGQVDLAITSDPSLVEADIGTVYNLMEVFYAAVRIDFGHWTPDNLFTNVTSYNSLISQVAGVSSDFRNLAASKPLAYLNRTSPPSPDVSTRPAVIRIPYTCNTRRRKSTGSFIVSVMSATLSVFLSVWGLVTAILGTLARREPGANACNVAHAQALVEKSRMGLGITLDHMDEEMATHGAHNSTPNLTGYDFTPFLRQKSSS